MRPVNTFVGDKEKWKWWSGQADGYPTVSLPSLQEGVSRCHVVEQPVIDCHEISISQSYRKKESLQKPKAAN